MSKPYRISELASEFGITTRTIRFYEEKGLLTPSRQANSRLYSDSDRVKLKLILRGKRLGFSLQESCEIIALYNPQQGNEKQLQVFLNKIQQKRQQLIQQQHDIEIMLQELKNSEQQCLAYLANKSKTT